MKLIEARETDKKEIKIKISLSNTDRKKLNAPDWENDQLMANVVGVIFGACRLFKYEDEIPKEAVGGGSELTLLRWVALLK